MVYQIYYHKIQTFKVPIDRITAFWVWTPRTTVDEHRDFG